VSWLSWLVRQPSIWKALLGQIGDAIKKCVSKMSSWQFLCLSVITAGIVAVVLLCVPKPPVMPSLPIVAWFSEMGAATNSSSYHSDDTKKAIKQIRRGLDVFDVRHSQPEESRNSADHRKLSIEVACYGVQGPDGPEKRELVIDLRIDGTKLPELRETDYVLSDAYGREIAQKIRKCVLGRYPPEGFVYKLPDGNKEGSSVSAESPMRRVTLGVGRLTGVRAGDVFQVVPPRKKETLLLRAREIKVMMVAETQAEGFVSADAQIEEGWGVKWKRAGS